MRSEILVVFSILAFASCSTVNSTDLSAAFTRNENDSVRIYKDSKGTIITITNSMWFTTTTDSKSFGQVNLAITGSTNADRVTVLTIGDGVLSEQEILLETDKSFKPDTIGISFSHFSEAPPTTEFERTTFIKGYKGSDTLTVTLNSGKLKY
jgi:hypothetical protein